MDGVSIKQHKGIKNNIDMNFLGKINVLCGKNNSGKTTLLSALKDDEYCLIGISISVERLVSVVQGNKLSDAPEEVVRNQFQQMFNELEKTPALKRVWLIEDIDEILIPNIEQHCPAIQGVTELRNTLVEQVNLTEKTKREFIPSKRKINDLFEIKYDYNLETNGNGVLNHLFELKNKLDYSAQKQRYLKIKKQFNFITDGYDFEIDLNKQTINLYFTNNMDEWVHSNDSGMGLKDLLIILFYMHIPDLEVLLIDEIEAHMHPDMQRKLLHVMREECEKQFILTTHSNVFLDINKVDKIFHTFIQKDYGILVDNATPKSAILNDIGFSVSDNLISDLVILIEGPSDKPVIEEFLNKMGLLTYNLKIWPLGGDIMDQLDLSVFKDAYKIIALIDNDPGSESVRNRFIKKCEELEIDVYRLERYSIENYFSIDALREVYKNQISKDFVLNPKEKLEHQLFNVKKRNRSLARHTSLDSIKNTDLYKFLKLVQESIEEEIVSS